MKNYQRDHAKYRYNYFPSNHNKVINNPKFFEKLLFPSIKKKINTDLLSIEEDYLKTDVKNIGMNYFAKFKFIEEIVEDLSTRLSEKVLKKRNTKINPNYEMNTKEYLKSQLDLSTDSPSMIRRMVLENNEEENDREDKKSEDRKNSIRTTINYGGGSSNVNISSLFGFYNSEDILKVLNPSELHRHRYIYLDTRYRNVSENDGTREFRWDYINAITVANGTINGVGKMQNIISMRTSNFTIPRTQTGDYETNLITMGVKEFFSQSFICHENHKFHISFFPTIDQDFIRLDAFHMLDGRYNFNNPITQLTTITILFGSPLQRIIFDKDRLSSTIAPSLNSVITTEEDHNLSSGNYIIIENYTTKSKSNDSIIISNVNDPRGLPVSVLSSNSFSIPVDLTSAKPVIQGTTSMISSTTEMIGNGTEYLTELYVGQYVLFEMSSGDFYNNTVSRQQIASITDNDTADIGVIWDPLLLDRTNLYVRPQLLGTVSVVVGVSTATITGIGTSFTTELKEGDVINITDSLGRYIFETIISITSPTQMTTTNVELLTTSPPLVADIIIFKNNEIKSLNFITYFQSKRIMIPMELTFITDKLNSSA